MRSIPNSLATLKGSLLRVLQPSHTPKLVREKVLVPTVTLCRPEGTAGGVPVAIPFPPTCPGRKMYEVELGTGGYGSVAAVKRGNPGGLAAIAHVPFGCNCAPPPHLVVKRISSMESSVKKKPGCWISSSIHQNWLSNAPCAPSAIRIGGRIAR